jgi:hypothetical protein
VKDCESKPWYLWSSVADYRSPGHFPELRSSVYGAKKIDPMTLYVWIRATHILTQVSFPLCHTHL